MSRRLAVIAVLALAAPVAAQAGPPGTWTKVTGLAHPSSNPDRVSLARTPDGVLHFLSVPQTASGYKVPVQHRSLSANAKKLSAATNMFTYPNGANQSTLLLAVPGGLRAFFAGLYPMNPLDVGLATATSANGSAWAVKPALASQASPPKSVYVSSGIGGALLKNGTFLTAWGDAGAGAHLGIDPFTADFAYSPGPCCVYDPGIAVDAATGHAIAAWKFIRSTSGMAARTLNPLGTKVKVFGDSATETGQTTAITGRLGGKAGVYIAYGRGTNLFSARPAVWRFGSSKTKTLSSVAGVHSVGISPGPAGRLWVFWGRYHDGYVYARRSNPATTAWGALRKVKTVKGAKTVWRVAGEGSDGPLDIFALVDRSATDFGYWQTRILPGLSLKATKGKKGKKVSVTFKVTDAGQAIGGVAVKVAGVGVKTTSAKGKATFTLAAGKYGVQAEKEGYARAKLKLKVAT